MSGYSEKINLVLFAELVLRLKLELVFKDVSEIEDVIEIIG